MIESLRLWVIIVCFGAVGPDFPLALDSVLHVPYAG
jgi:hypothetical protein